MRSNRTPEPDSGFVAERKKNSVTGPQASQPYSSADWQATAGFYKEANSIRRLLETKLDTLVSRLDANLRPDYGTSPIQLKFRGLVARWKEATGHFSSPNDIAIHPAYQQIIGMGPDALPLIFQELRDRGGNWYWALKAITGEDPVPETDRGKVQLMKRAWLKWAEDRYL